MSALHEQAREAVHAEFPLPGQADVPAYIRLADAASDVWEPIVELLREALICADHVDWGLSPDDAAKVREILGNGAPRR